jgi:hypothetical protein
MMFIPTLLDTLFPEHAQIKAQCTKAMTILHWQNLATLESLTKPRGKTLSKLSQFFASANPDKEM